MWLCSQDGPLGLPAGGGKSSWLAEPPRGWAPASQHHPNQQQHSRPGGDVGFGSGLGEQRRLQQLEAQLEASQQENQRLQRQVSELSAAVTREQERADAAAAGLAAGPRSVGTELQRAQGCGCCNDLGPLRRTNEAAKHQLLVDSRAEMTAAAARAQGGASRAEAVLLGELEQQRQVAASLRRELQKAVATLAREKEALAHEVRHWQLAANQAATVAERAQQKVTAAEQRLEAQADQVRSQARELGALQQQLAAARASLEQRTAQLERLDASLMQPLLSWHVEADPGVAPALVAGMGMARGAVGPSRGSHGSPPPLPAGRPGALARGGGGGSREAGVQGKFRSEAAMTAAATDTDPAAEHHVRAAVAAFEALRVMAQQARSAREQLQSALDVKEDLRNALAMERATAELRATEVQRLSDVEARLEMQVEELNTELGRVKLESAQALKAAQEMAEEAQVQRAAAAFERGRQMGDRQAAVAVAALRGELQDHALALQRERELCERAVADARRAGELAVEAARREGELAVVAARREGEAEAERARTEAEAALRRARAEWESAVKEAERRAEAARREAAEAAAEAQRYREAAAQRGAAEGELQVAAEAAERRASSLAEQLQGMGEQAAEALAKCEQYLQQVSDLTQELQRARQQLAEKDSLAATVAKEHDAAISELQARLCECRQRLAAQAEQLEEYAVAHDGERAATLESLRARLDHVGDERDSLQAECVALRQQLSAAQTAAAAVEVEMDAMSSALESHKAARAAAEAAAEDAHRSAAAATAAAEDGAARVAALTQQLQEAALLHERELGFLEARCAADLDAAQLRYQAELEGLQARLKMLRLKQSRVMAYVDDVFMGSGTAEETERGQGQQQGQGQGQQGPERQQPVRVLQPQRRQQQRQRDRGRDQSPRWGQERDWEEPLGGGTGWAGQEEGRQGWRQRASNPAGSGLALPEKGSGEEEGWAEAEAQAVVHGGRGPLGGGDGGGEGLYGGGQDSGVRQYGVG
ncbi:hypothetical protein PLESTB_000821400 [Pleodorina starrii]|uniref:Uncharacterized protein n=1 Tax=Pleodorina starrii TaxID=330485 RepID=A0A9W6BL90_9CHLO|nr:hypothetical protein PLESTB_000821400 [Pleodorina starrii]GLC64617.1 hypothetical protein PLESTF_000185000 [Pleodorina starrii]